MNRLLKDLQSLQHHNLIVRLPNWVGDVIMTLPALQALEQAGVKLYLLGKPWIMDLLAGTNAELIPITPNFWQTVKTIVPLPSDKILLLTNSLSSAIAARFARKKAIGYKTDGRQLLLTACLTKEPGHHEVVYFWEMAHLAFQHWFPKLKWPAKIPKTITLPIRASATNKAALLLEKAGIKPPFWVLCPFAHGTGNHNQSKIWPYWAQLSEALSHQLIVCPGKSEVHLCKELVPQATVLPDLNLEDYAAILSQAQKIIANDSGPMHIAAAVGTDTLGIFGVSNPKRTAPWGAHYIGKENKWPTVTEVLQYLERN